MLKNFILSIPFIYDFFQWLVGAPAQKKWLVKNYLRPHLTGSILDIGCGTGEMYTLIGSPQNYIGIDINPIYLETARLKYPEAKMNFLNFDLSKQIPPLEWEGKFDVCYMGGVIHHLNDEQFKTITSNIKKILSESGVLITIDPVLHDGQNLLAKYFVTSDRGEYVRTEVEYKELVGSDLTIISSEIRNLLRIPYSNIIFCSQKSKKA